MKKFVFGAAISAAMMVSGGASALTDAELDAMLADVQLQCAALGSLAQCDALVQAKIAQLEADGLIDDSGRAAAVARVVETAISALNTSSAPNGQVAVEIDQIIGRATTAMNTIKTRTPAAAAAVNSAVSRATVAVLVAVQERNLNSNPGQAGQVGNALTALANTSTDTNQRNAVQQIATVINNGGSVVDIIDEIEVLNSYASPA